MKAETWVILSMALGAIFALLVEQFMPLIESLELYPKTAQSEIKRQDVRKNATSEYSKDVGFFSLELNQQKNQPKAGSVPQNRMLNSVRKVQAKKSTGAQGILMDAKSDFLTTIFDKSLQIAAFADTSDDLMDWLSTKNVKAIKLKAGTKQFGERFEIIAESINDGLEKLEADFNILADGTQEMVSMRTTAIVENDDQFDLIRNKMREDLSNMAANLVVDSKHVMRWELENGLAVWMKKQTSEGGKSQVQVATEYGH